MRCALFRSIVTAGLVLFWATALPMFAAPSGEGWSQLETENFILISQVDEGSTRTVGADLERLRFALEQIFDQAAFDSPLSTFLYVFRDQGSFAPYSLGGGEPGAAAAQCHRHLDCPHRDPLDHRGLLRWHRALLRPGLHSPRPRR